MDYSSASKLCNSPLDYDFYEALSSLVNLWSITINLDSDTVFEIGDFAFSKFDRQNVYSYSIHISGNGIISRIANYAFYDLPSSGYIGLKVNSINYISVHILLIGSSLMIQV